MIWGVLVVGVLVIEAMLLEGCNFSESHKKPQGKDRYKRERVKSPTFTDPKKYGASITRTPTKLPQLTETAISAGALGPSTDTTSAYIYRERERYQITGLLNLWQLDLSQGTLSYIQDPSTKIMRTLHFLI